MDSTFLRIWAVADVVDVVGPWDFSYISLDISVNYPSCTYDDWYDLHFLVPHSVTNIPLY